MTSLDMSANSIGLGGGYRRVHVLLRREERKIALVWGAPQRFNEAAEAARPRSGCEDPRAKRPHPQQAKARRRLAGMLAGLGSNLGAPGRGSWGSCSRSAASSSPFMMSKMLRRGPSSSSGLAGGASSSVVDWRAVGIRRKGDGPVARRCCCCCCCCS